jgi:hypothetical protein
MDEEHRTKKVSELLQKAARRMKQAQQTRDPVRAATLMAEAAKLRADVAKLEKGH